MKPRAAVSLGLIVALALPACAANDPAADPSSGAVATAPLTAQASGSALPLPALDVERETALLADGLEEGEAEFLALTTLESEVLDPHSYRVVATFPTGDQGDLTFVLTPDQVGDPAVADLTHEEVGDEFRFRLVYLVPWDVIPADLHEEIRQGTTAAVPFETVLAAAPAARAAQVAADSNGVGVVVTGVIKQLYGQAAGETARILDSRFGGRLDVSTTLRMLRALEGVGNALASSAEYREIVAELDEIEECARNPTNPITQRAYRDDPAYQQRVLDQIAATRSEVKANASVLYLSHLIKTGSSLIRNVPALGFIVGPGTAWSKAALNEVTRKLIDDLKKNVPACEEALQFEFSGSGTAIDGASNASVPITWSYWGLRCPESQEWTLWEIFDGIQQSANTLPPGTEGSLPLTTTFDREGAVTSSVWPQLGDLVQLYGIHTLQGTALTLSPNGEDPTEVIATIREGTGPPQTVRAPVEPADEEMIALCPPVEGG